MIYFQSKVLTIEYLDELKSGIGNWKGFATEAEYKTGLNKVIDLLKDKKINKWIANLSEMEAISDDLQRWANEDWFPRALEAGVKYMAVVVSSDVFNQLAVESIMTKVGDLLVQQFFPSVEEAKKWVQQQD